MKSTHRPWFFLPCSRGCNMYLCFVLFFTPSYLYYLQFSMDKGTFTLIRFFLIQSRAGPSPLSGEEKEYNDKLRGNLFSFSSPVFAVFFVHLRRSIYLILGSPTARSFLRYALLLQFWIKRFLEVFFPVQQEKLLCLEWIHLSGLDSKVWLRARKQMFNPFMRGTTLAFFRKNLQAKLKAIQLINYCLHAECMCVSKWHQESLSSLKPCEVHIRNNQKVKS